MHNVIIQSSREPLSLVCRDATPSATCLLILEHPQTSRLCESDGQEQSQLADSLTDAGWCVLTANDLGEAQALARTYTEIDAILLVIEAPDAASLAVCRELKTTPQLQEAPILFLGNAAPPEAILASFDAGGSDYIARPTSTALILARLKTHGAAYRNLRSTRRELACMRKGEKAVDAAAAPIVITDYQGTIQWANHAFSRLTGYARDEALGKNPRDLVRSDVQKPEFYEKLWATIRAGEVWQGALVNRRKDGSHYLEEMTISPVKDDKGKITRFIAVKVDITERDEMLTALQEAQERLERAVRAGNVGLWEWDIESNRVRFSEQWKRQLGYQNEEQDDRYETWIELLHPTDREHIPAAIQAYVEDPGRGYEETFRMLHKDGSYRWILSQGELICDATGKPVRMVGSHIDITEQKRLQTQFLQAQRLESVGRLAGGVAHDFNNLLTVIGGYVDMAIRRAEKTDTDPILKNQIVEVGKATERATELTKRLLMISRQEVIARKVMDLNENLREMESVLRRLIGEDMVLNLQLEDSLWSVEADPTQMQQVVMNLVVNARDAMPDGGTLILETTNVTVDAPRVALHSTVPQGRYVRLRVRDEGVGMDETIMGQLFEPFFTTKSRNKGTGLGLATSAAIIQQSRGYIQVASVPNMGSTFDVYLPRTLSITGKAQSTGASGDAPAGASSVTSSVAAAVTPQAVQATILVVEDEGELRQLVHAVLTAAGYSVLQAQDSTQAEEIATAHTHTGGVIDLLLTDVVMPGRNGRELAERMQRQYPRMRALYMSGYTNDDILRRGVSNQRMHFLAKPFGIGELIAKVQSVLDGD